MLSRSMRDLDIALGTPSKYSSGQKVKIDGDKERVKRLQLGHGGYTPTMDGYLGKVGTVANVDRDGDVNVKFSDGRSWCYNPACVNAVDSSEDSSDDSDSDVTVSEGLDRMIRQLLGMESNGGSGSAGAKVELKTTPLHAACFSGNEAVVRMVVATGADLEEEDKDGDKALHYAAYGDKPDIIELLLNSGANINATNKRKATVLHTAVNKEFVNSVRTLMTKFGERLNVNAQDSDGDTPLHDAVTKNSLEVIDLLVNAPAIDFTIKNKRGHSALHHAAMKGNNFAVERIISKSPDIIDMKDKEGFTSLHLAALSNSYDVAKTLLTQGRCSVDLKTNKEQTALWMAVYKGHCDIAELLVGAGANINAPDDDGDTPMHMSLLKRSDMRVQSASPSTAPEMAAIVSQLLETTQSGVDSSLAMACFLANRGADLHRKNKEGITPLQMANSAPVVEQLLIWRTKKRETTTKTTSVAATISGDGSGTCKICCEAAADVWFEPCGHRLYCSECCRRMKCCLTCGVAITGKVTSAERQGASADAERQRAQRELEARLQELEEAHGCSICMERQRNVVFLCGHGACDDCAADLDACHMCRETITKRIKLY
ncbi:hypothetical protein V5799_006411 [Amblyomma americanum]|uniref:RING-type E3 ubiquitin transferase n=1 Tax=Amblyomma americanum TaxID=6943 RepID=A0AAQ4DWH0_AMBAM